MIQTTNTDHRTLAQRWADAVTEFCGSWAFVSWFTGLIIVWVFLNTAWLLFGTFDAYPFIALNLVLTVVSTLQGPLIMMSQNRQADRDREAVMEIHAKLDEILKDQRMNRYFRAIDAASMKIALETPIHLLAEDFE